MINLWKTFHCKSLHLTSFSSLKDRKLLLEKKEKEFLSLQQKNLAFQEQFLLKKSLYQKLFADLKNNPQSHVLMHELIHGGDEDNQGGCLSYNLLFEAIEYKLQFPDQVHLIMGNHDTSFINNSRVMKGGKEMNQSLREAMDREFGEDSEEVKLSMRQFLFSQPLAIRCPNHKEYKKLILAWKRKNSFK